MSELSKFLLSPAALGSSWIRSSIIVPNVLIVTGALLVMHRLIIGTAYVMDLAGPSMVIGFTYGIAVLVLGLAKGISPRWRFKWLVH